MNEVFEVLHREFVYVWYYFTLQLRQIVSYWILGMIVGSLVSVFAKLFSETNEGFGALMAATIGVPLYACGGGTIPLIREWLYSGMSMGSAAAFMLTGPSTKITNLRAENSVGHEAVLALSRLCHGVFAIR